MVAESSHFPEQHVRSSTESRCRMRCGLKLTTPVMICCVAFALTSHAEEAEKKSDEGDAKTGLALDPMLGLDPTIPRLPHCLAV